MATLLKNKADVNLRLPGASTALFEATGRRDVETTKILLEQHADPNAVVPGGAVALHRALTPELATLLLNSGAQVNASDAYGITPLSEAISNHATEVAKIFIAHGADVDAKASV